MKKNSIKLLVLTVAIFIAQMILPGVDVKNIWVAMILAFVISLLNRFVKPIIKIISLPFTILTLGLFLFIINGIIVSLAEFILPDDWFKLSSFFIGIVFSLSISILASIIEWILGIKKEDQ